jgi:hypothetical protein
MKPAGGFFSGGGSRLPAVGNLSAASVGFGLATVDFAGGWDERQGFAGSTFGDGPDVGAVYYVMVDGLPQRRLASEREADVGPLSVGVHDIDVLPWLEGWSRGPGVSLDGSGTRVLLRWDRGTEADLVGWNLYNDSKTGTVSYATAVAELRDVVVDDFEGRTPTTGTGTGRLTVRGAWSGGAFNGVWKVKVTTAAASGVLPTFALDTGGGYGASRVFDGTGTVALGSGLTATWLDGRGDYDLNDEWEVRIGPDSKWVSGELEAGTWKFGIKAVDGAGNESAAVETTVVVGGEPGAPSGVSAAYNASNGEVTFAWTDGTDADTVAIYGNIVAGTVIGSVYELAPMVATAADGAHVLATGLSGDVGTLRFYLRSRNASGTEEVNRALIEVDTAAQVASVSGGVGSVIGLTGAASAGGTALISWEYDLRDGVPSSWVVYTFESEPSASDVASAVAAEEGTGVAATLTTERGGSIVAASWTSGVLAGERWFVVHAVDGDGDEDAGFESVAVTPDASAPGDVSGFGAGVV